MKTLNCSQVLSQALKSPNTVTSLSLTWVVEGLSFGRAGSLPSSARVWCGRGEELRWGVGKLTRGTKTVDALRRRSGEWPVLSKCRASAYTQKKSLRKQREKGWRSAMPHKGALRKLFRRKLKCVFQKFSLLDTWWELKMIQKRLKMILHLKNLLEWKIIEKCKLTKTLENYWKIVENFFFFEILWKRKIVEARMKNVKKRSQKKMKTLNCSQVLSQALK